MALTWLKSHVWQSIPHRQLPPVSAVVPRHVVVATKPGAAVVGAAVVVVVSSSSIRQTRPNDPLPSTSPSTHALSLTHVPSASWTFAFLHVEQLPALLLMLSHSQVWQLALQMQAPPSSAALPLQMVVATNEVAIVVVGAGVVVVAVVVSALHTRPKLPLPTTKASQRDSSSQAPFESWTFAFLHFWQKPARL